MKRKQILFITGSIGLGHLTRDLATAASIRLLNPEADLVWLAYQTVKPLLEKAGETVLTEADQLSDVNEAADSAARKGFHLNLTQYVNRARKGWMKNAEVLGKIINQHEFDLVIGDETYELVLALLHGQLAIKPTFLSIYDFLGLEPMVRNPMERLACFLIARKFAKRAPENVITYAYVGDEEDVVDRPWGFGLPNRRQWARQNCHFVGYITPFDPQDFSNSSRVRKELGYGTEPLIICSIGGTAVGAELLELCGMMYGLVSSSLPGLRMVLVCGPRLDPKTLHVPEGPEIRGYVKDLFKHFAASDLAIVQAGGTTTTELTALNKPFLYFPLEEHYEQQVYVSGRLQRHGAGVKMRFPETTPESLAEAVLANIGREVDYPSIPIDGAQNIAKMVKQLLAQS
jgi:UDP-N-acetylglucosamine:LPS N-acetylglucosamine transferase